MTSNTISTEAIFPTDWASQLSIFLNFNWTYKIKKKNLLVDIKTREIVF